MSNDLVCISTISYDFCGTIHTDLKPFFTDAQTMATPRSKLVDPHVPMHYHIISRCVRRGWLCGKDPATRKNYNHRKDWLETRLMHLARCFAVEIEAYAIMSNHFHLVVYFNPTACREWSAEEVTRRWIEAFPPIENGEVVESIIPKLRKQLLDNAALLEIRRK